jgi:hypothetical protein
MVIVVPGVGSICGADQGPRAEGVASKLLLGRGVVPWTRHDPSCPVYTELVSRLPVDTACCI